MGPVPVVILKAGLSFLAVYDGSCFDPIQAIVNNDIENCESEVLR